MSFSLGCTVSPNTSVMSTSFSSMPMGSCQSKQYTRFASMISTVAIPKLRPGQILRPVPNGKKLKWFPLMSTPAALPRAVHEPLRQELLWLLPRARVSAKSPGVDDDPGAGGDVVAIDDAVRQGQVRDEERGRWVQPQRLLHHGSQVGHVG
jgi:hypothetical protein